MANKETPHIDINKIAAEFVQKNIATFVNAATGILKKATDEVHLHLNRTYKAYIKCIGQKCSRTKSFLIRGEPVYLYKFFVPMSVQMGKTSIRGVGSHQLPRCSVIVASGGSGKSMLMKHLVLDSLIQQQKVPVFIQLQHFNHSDLDLVQLLQSTLLNNKFKMDEEYVIKAINSTLLRQA